MSIDDLVARRRRLRAQIDEDERVADAATPGPWTTPYDSGTDGWLVHNARGKEYALTVAVMHSADPEADATHIARHDPATALRDIAAKRAILDEYDRALQRSKRHPGDVASSAALLTMVGVVGLLTEAATDPPNRE